MDQFKKFFELAERVGCIVDKGDVPDLSKAPRQLLAPFQEHVNNGVDSNQSTPAKTSGRGSNLASPVQLSGNGPDLANEALREEARALEKFSRNKVSEADDEEFGGEIGVKSEFEIEKISFEEIDFKEVCVFADFARNSGF